MSDNQQRIKDLYHEIQEAKKKQKEYTATIKEAFVGTKEYQDLADEMTKLRARKKQIEQIIRADYSSEFNSLEDVRTDIRDTRQVLSDIMWNELMKNNKVEVVDENNNTYVPEVKVTLKKLA